MRIVRLLLVGLVVLLATYAVLSGMLARGPTLPESTYGGRAAAYPTKIGALRGRLYLGARFAPGADLVVVLHGDAPTARPGYQYRAAAAGAAAMPDAAFLALLRPGYTDPMGARSDGVRGLTVGDNYTADRVEALAEAILAARAALRAGRVLIVGHSGGAALTALLLARRPDVSRSGILVSCPCDLATWRRHMALRQFNPLFLVPTRSLDPLAAARSIPHDTRISVLVGSHDAVTPPGISRTYVAARGKGQVELAPGGHEILGRPEVLAAIARMRRDD